ncbi:unnamed protein product [Fraxinus pennsylvanica]|uniref:Uncharacterized protein n=1 Tax=Fraxinus pennsylvanica TaxID=56036 RepID=A0AAD2E5X1_9LAMI|nr:unnamed protein product [Fraxinus pennsylvanica]
MVEVEEEETPSLRKYKSCCVHEHIQNQCLELGKEYYFKVLDFGHRTQRRADSNSFSSTSNPARGMALHLDSDSFSSTSNSVDQNRNEEVNHLRSLLLLNPKDRQVKFEWRRKMFNLKRCRMLRVLTFERVDFQERGLPSKMTWPTYLRYLSFKGCILRVLPSSIGILEDLEQIVGWDVTSVHASTLCLSIKIKNFDCYTEKRHSVFRKLLSWQILHSLHMDGHLGQIPLHNKITSSLTEMVLIGSELKEDPMATLDKLPELQVLELQDDAFAGKKMICVKSGFKKLKRLELLNLHFLETWEVEEESMPMLSVLAVKNCGNLKIPPQHELRNRFPSKSVENDN